jgi:hypothetical protein
MADPPPNSDAGDRPDLESNTGTPRWVKVFGTIAIIVLLLFVIMLVAGGGRHGPGRHRLFRSSAEGSPTPSAGAIQGERTSPEAGHL